MGLGIHQRMVKALLLEAGEKRKGTVKKTCDLNCNTVVKYLVNCSLLHFAR